MEFIPVSQTCAQNDEGTLVQIMSDGRVLHLSLEASFFIPRIAGTDGSPDIIDISNARWYDGTPVDPALGRLLKADIAGAFNALEITVIFS